MDALHSYPEIMETMPEPSASDQESREKNDFPYIHKVAELFEKGLDVDEEAYGYHGTSIEAIEHLARTGVLPSTASYGGRFYFIPQGVTVAFGQTDEEHAESYSEINAQKAYVLSRLPFRPSDMETFHNLFDAPDETDMEIFFEEAEKHNFSRGDLSKLLTECRKQKRRGIVLTLSPKIKEEFKVEEDVDSEQRSIATEGGLPIEFITGIDPRGEYEYGVMMKIQEYADKLSKEG